MNKKEVIFEKNVTKALSRKGGGILEKGTQILASYNSWMVLFSFEDYETMAVYGFWSWLFDNGWKREPLGGEEVSYNDTDTGTQEHNYKYWHSIIGTWERARVTWKTRSAKGEYEVTQETFENIA